MSASFLTQAQREALAEFDARPSKYMPRWKITAVGAALFFDVEAKNEQERLARDCGQKEIQDRFIGKWGQQ
jgi:hypothetical protein